MENLNEEESKCDKCKIFKINKYVHVTKNNNLLFCEECICKQMNKNENPPYEFIDGYKTERAQCDICKLFLTEDDRKFLNGMSQSLSDLRPSASGEWICNECIEINKDFNNLDKCDFCDNITNLYKRCNKDICVKCNNEVKKCPACENIYYENEMIQEGYNCFYCEECYKDFTHCYECEELIKIGDDDSNDAYMGDDDEYYCTNCFKDKYGLDRLINLPGERYWECLICYDFLREISLSLRDGEFYCNDCYTMTFEDDNDFEEDWEDEETEEEIIRKIVDNMTEEELPIMAKKHRDCFNEDMKKKKKFECELDKKYQKIKVITLSIKKLEEELHSYEILRIKTKKKDRIKVIKLNIVKLETKLYNNKVLKKHYKEQIKSLEKSLKYTTDLVTIIKDTINKFKKINEEFKNTEVKNCNICMNSTKKLATLKCHNSHKLCTDCIRKLSKLGGSSKCPYCRAVIENI